jgi:tetratricopeptide (TPR) repeat protein
VQFQSNQFADAKVNVHQLMQHQNYIPDTVQAEFPPVFRVLGLNSLLPETLRQDTTSQEVQTELVDIYLLKGNKTGDLLPETLQDADRVRTAFEKIEAEQDEDALELLRPISFRSPLAEWRLLLRGLVDHYHGKADKAEESWKRLSPNRPPARIVARLKTLMHEKTSAASTAPASGGLLAGLFSMFRGSKDTKVSHKAELLETLRVLDDYLKRGKDKELLGRFQSGKSLFQKEMPMQFARLFDVVHHYMIDSASPTTALQFVDRNLPLPLDPRGNRTLAMLSQRVDCDSRFRRPGGLAYHTVYWIKFAEEDIDLIESFSPPMKARAKAVVWDFMAKRVHDELSDAREEAYDEEDFHEMIDVPQTAKKIEDFLEKAITSDPIYVPPYQQLISFIVEMLPREEQKDQFHPRIVEIFERLHRNAPNEKEALNFLFEYHLQKKNADAARLYLNHLLELDPLSRENQLRRTRFFLGQIRNALRQRDFKRASDDSRELSDGQIGRAHV